MAEPIVLASSLAGRVELIRGRRSRPALDVKFVPAHSAVDLDSGSWISYIAWADKDDVHDRWHIGVTPDFVTRDELQHLPTLQANSESAARAWLVLLGQTWLRLVDDHASTASSPRVVYPGTTGHQCRQPDHPLME